MKKYEYWTFKVIWTFLSLFIAQYIRIRYNTSLGLFVIIIIPIALIGEYLVERFIRRS